MMKTIRVYADTSVFGGVFDKEFISPSQSFFEQVRSGLITLFTSALVQEEISYAPAEVRELFEGYSQVSIYSPSEVIRYD